MCQGLGKNKHDKISEIDRINYDSTSDRTLKKPLSDVDRCPLRRRPTPSPPTKSLDFRGSDSSRLLILRGGSSHVRIIV